MKQIMFAISGMTLSLVLTSNTANAQWTTSGTNVYTTSGSSNVGINDNAPSEKLTVDGKISFTRQNASLARVIQGNCQSGNLVLFGNQNNGTVGNPTLNTQTGGSSIILNSNATNAGSLAFIAGGDKGTLAGPNIGAFDYLVFNNGGYDLLMRIMKNGKVTIGDAWVNAPGNYKLYVDDGILTEKLKVAVLGTGNWSDYVFADNYELKPLDEVENFINENKHLPDVPSADEVVKDGIDVATMDAKLLQKIEELTLYVIKQQKQIDALQKQAHQ
ncbi:MAG: hypothetical protein EOP51_05105 [Sphingobacteriales bacterium]|nr:MAG: hypothetical protein EOP51_05105 [Sphingobacteriales bacterium]